MATKIPERNEIRESDKWAIHDLYANDEAWQRDYEETATMEKKVAAYQGKLGQSAEALLSYLRLYDEISTKLENLGNYAQRRSDEDTRVASYQAMTAKFLSLYVEMQTATAFETTEILAIPDETLESYYQVLPDLALYRRRIYNIRRAREHILSDAEERLLASAGDVQCAGHHLLHVHRRRSSFPGRRRLVGRAACPEPGDVCNMSGIERQGAA